MPALEFRTTIWTLVAVLATFPAIVFAEGIWSADIGSEPSAVKIGDDNQFWWTNRIQASYRDPAIGGFWVAGETQRRESPHDETLIAGGYRRLGDWTLLGQVSGSPDHDFVAKYSIEPTIARRLFGNFVGQVGYIYRSFEASRVQIGSLSGIQYFATGEVELRVGYGKNNPLNRPIRILMLRGLWDDGSAISFGGSGTVGDNLFDAANVPGASGNFGWVLNANMRYRFDDRNSVRLDLTTGREDPSFRQHTLGLSYRRLF